MQSHYRIIWIVGLLGALLLLVGQTRAQDALPSKAGLVVQFSDGSVATACVDLGPDRQATGLEVLTASGLQLLLENTPGYGAAVCQIESDGCAFPAEPCFCKCTLGGGEACRYWSYSRLVGDRWQYSQIGAGRTIVEPGSVEGWAWGSGTTSNGSQPPIRQFAEICAVPTPVVATIEPTLAPAPGVAEATAPAATATLQPLLETRLPTPSTAALPTERPTQQPTAVATRFRLPTDTPERTPLPAERVPAQNAPAPNSAAIAPTQPPEAPAPLEAARTDAAPPGAPIALAPVEAAPADTQTVRSSAPSDSQTDPINYLVFGVLVAVLAAGWGIAQRRRTKR
jgi:hypothetical protein